MQTVTLGSMSLVMLAANKMYNVIHNFLVTLKKFFPLHLEYQRLSRKVKKGRQRRTLGCPRSSIFMGGKKEH